MTMLTQILLHTPRWVFALFILLVAAGARQLLPGQASLRRVAVLPLFMSALSLAAVVSTFPMQATALIAWALATALVAAGVMTRPVPHGTSYDLPARRFRLAGSAVPLVLMLGVFAARYAVGASLALHPALARDAMAALAVGSLYGALSGLFLGRALRLWRVAMNTAAAWRALPA
jgi:Ca2+/Na+ antiporter